MDIRKRAVTLKVVVNTIYSLQPLYCVSPKGVNYYELEIKRALSESCVKIFPSPTGVNYYELKDGNYIYFKGCTSFRPQQGLTIMNLY